MSYSKFAQTGARCMNVPSRLGMVLLYAPAGLLACACYVGASPWGALPASASVSRYNTVALMLSLHFGKRVMECLFLHKYSGSMPLGSSLNISVFYTIICALICFYTAQVPRSAFEPRVRSPALALFALGLVGNLYHHYLLATLRKPGEKGYKVPRGGFFELVAAPHYFFELIGWAGITLMSQHSITALGLVGMTLYLVDRAIAQTAWNLKKLENYPKNRGHIVPFIF